MERHVHTWEASYEHRGSTYRECTDPACRAHQQWICALDRWSETFETPAPRARDEEGRERRRASAVG